VPTPDSIQDESRSKKREGGNNQKERLFSRGKDISGEPIMRGVSQLPKPPISVGITKKKIMIKAWAVTIEL